MAQESKRTEDKCVGGDMDTEIEIWWEKHKRWGWRKFERNKMTGRISVIVWKNGNFGISGNNTGGSVSGGSISGVTRAGERVSRGTQRGGSGYGSGGTGYGSGGGQST